MSAGQCVLPATGEFRTRFSAHVNGFVVDGSHYHLTIYSPLGMEGAQRWWGSENRFDDAGREWSRSVRFVVNDHGDMVEVTR